MKEMVKMYRLLNEEQRNKIFTKEQIECLYRLDFFDRLFTDKAFYKAVETAVGETIYDELRA